MILHPPQVYLRIQVSFLSNFDKLSEGQVLLDQWELVVLGPVVDAAVQVYFDQLEHCYLQDLELGVGFELQVLVPDFDLPDLELGCRTLYHVHKLILSIGISWIRGVWSIHLFSNLLPNQNLFEYLTHFNFVLFPSINIKHMSFFSTGKVYMTDFTRISQIQYYCRPLMVKDPSHLRLLSLLLISLLCQHS